jgi:protein-arginine deiminase
MSPTSRPDLANFQPANQNLVVFPKTFGPMGGGQDIFQQATTSVIANATFADVWDLYHRQDGEVHCATEVTRNFFSFNWWEK